MKKTYFLCDLTSQQLLNLENRIKNDRYHTIQLFNKKYYDDNKYIECDIMIFNKDSLEWLKCNLFTIKHDGFKMRTGLFLNRYYVKVWY